MYAELKKRYEYESSSQKIRIAELTSDISTVNKDRSEMQADFTKFVGESRTIVKVRAGATRLRACRTNAGRLGPLCTVDDTSSCSFIVRGCGA